MIKEIISFFPSDFESVFALPLTSKVLSFEFIQRLFILSVSFGFHGLPLLIFKTDQVDLKGLDVEKMMSFTHYSVA